MNSPRNIYINVNTTKINDGLYAYSIILYLEEKVILQRDNKLVFYATLWDYSGVYSSNSADLKSSVQKDVLGIMDYLVRTYNKVNKIRKN